MRLKFNFILKSVSFAIYCASSAWVKAVPWTGRRPLASSNCLWRSGSSSLSSLTPSFNKNLYLFAVYFPDFACLNFGQKTILEIFYSFCQKIIYLTIAWGQSKNRSMGYSRGSRSVSLSGHSSTKVGFWISIPSCTATVRAMSAAVDCRSIFTKKFEVDVG